VEHVEFGPWDERPHVVVAVFPSEATALVVRDDLESHGVSADRIRIEDARDEVSSLRSEMRQELDDSFAGAAIAGPYTKEMSKGVVRYAIIGALIGALVLVPLSFIPVAGLAWWVRLLIGLAIGALAGLTCGAMIGGPLAARGPADALAAQRGVTLSVQDSGEAVETIMAGYHPLRVDVVDADLNPIEVVETNEGEQPDTAHDVARNLDRDDYHREPPSP
jgi:hypothetical protein